jgi:tetratricopeptide (TPR) repeat protein
MLYSACAFAVAALAAARPEPRRALPALVRAWLPWALLVAAHFAFRRVYYGAWLPNTYAAKVGGRTWWDSGFDYLAAFALEYALLLWLPLIVAGVVAYRRSGASHVPLLFGALALPHALYVAAIGGDHFEYRPLDLDWPFLALLAGRGAQALAGARAPARAAATALFVAFVAAASFELPWQSRAQFPARYLPGFPGGLTSEPERREWLDPRRHAIHRLPGLNAAAAAHREHLRRSSLRFVGLRAEEHARFLALVDAEGRRLRALVDQGVLPEDTHLATGCVGAIPYRSRLRTLDRLGLTDAVVAHAPPQSARIMAHDRSASFAYGRERGVDLWAAHDVHFLFRAGSTHPLNLIARRTAFWAAPTAPGEFLLAMFPLGADHARARFPRLAWQPGTSDAFLVPYFDTSVAALRDTLARRDDDARRRDLAWFLLLGGRFAEALAEYERVLARAPDDPEMLLQAGEARAQLGRIAEARADWERGLALARTRGDLALAGRLEHRLDAAAP